VLKYGKKIFENHLVTDHNISPIKKYLRDVVYGGNDGIISTFVVVSGFVGARSSQSLESSLPLFALLLFGFTNLGADAVSMAFGNFLSVRSAKDLYEDLSTKEFKKLHFKKQEERAETEYILIEQGFTTLQAREMTEIISQNRPYWLRFMMRSELGMPYVLDENPFVNALVTFLAFIFFGFFPLAPFVFNFGPHGFFFSVVFTGIALASLGFLRGYLTRKRLLKTMFEVVFVGALSATTAYLVGTFFRI